MARPALLLIGAARERVRTQLAAVFDVHALSELTERRMTVLAGQVRALAVMHSSAIPGQRLSGEFMQRFPALKIVSSFGVGYDHVDASWAAAHGLIVTNTPEVLNEEVADTALGLLLCTVRQLPQAMAYLKAGKWLDAPYPLSAATLRNRTVGLVGMGRIGQAIARRLEPFGVGVVYHARHQNPAVGYRYYPGLVAMARDVDTLVVIVPGGAGTRHLVDAEVLEALGSDGILINVARGSVVDQQALIDALAHRHLLCAGLDVYADEPNVPDELMRLDNVVLLPHVGSASVHTQGLMDQLLVDNLVAWALDGTVLTPVPETRRVMGS